MINLLNTFFFVTLHLSQNLLLKNPSFQMPTTRKQRAKERQSKQMDISSDMENADIMLGSYSRDDEMDDQG